MKATLTAAALALALGAPALVQAADKGNNTMVDDTLITTKVKTALIAEKGIDSNKISVETENGKVLLSGDVKSPDQRQRAEGLARKVSGVKEVDNKIQVK